MKLRERNKKTPRERVRGGRIDDHIKHFAAMHSRHTRTKRNRGYVQSNEVLHKHQTGILCLAHCAIRLQCC